MVPTFDKFMFPVLNYLKDGKERTNKEVQREMVRQFNLNDDDLQETAGKGSNKFLSNVNWALTFLYQAGLLTKPRKGHHIISKSGLDYLAEGITSITEKELVKRFGNVNPKFFYSNGKSSTTKPEAQEESATPEEVIKAACYKLKEALITELLDKVKSIDPRDFERLVVQLLVKMGYGGSVEDAARVTKYTGDGGIDGIIKEDALGLDFVYIQAKRYTTGVVGRPEVQAFVGALSPKPTNKGVFITTSSFSQQAIEYAKQVHDESIILVDGRQLCEYMIQYGLGVTTRDVIELKSIDSDFFDFQ